MFKLGKIILKFILYVWQLPQVIIGGFLFLWLKMNGSIQQVITYRGKKYFIIKNNFGVSFGEFVFLNVGNDTNSMNHEFGHSVQSVYFGPLYLLVIGIPSAIGNNLWDRIAHGSWSSRRSYEWYYNRYPENWADKLGGVQRF